MLSLLLVSLPEALLVTMLGFQLAGLGITPHHLIKTGMIQVTNAGDSIPPEIHERMYEPSFSTKKGNQGLGLAIAKEIVDKYSGRLTVEHIGGETIFSVHISDKGSGRGND